MTSFLGWLKNRRFLLLRGGTLLLWGCGLFLSLGLSPSDFRQGDCMRILYIHVPCSWLALLILTLMALASALFLIFRSPLADILAEALAPLGTLFTFLSLATGALWGKPVWGAFWVWDARLTSALILFFCYCGILGLRQAFSSPFEAQKPVAFFTLLAWINVPIIKGAVTWFHTLHQPASVFRVSGPSLPPQMLIPLLVMTAAFIGTAFLLTAWRLQIIELRYKVLARAQRTPSTSIWEKVA